MPPSQDRRDPHQRRCACRCQHPPRGADGWQCEAFAARIPMGRIVEPEEVAHAVAFLADNKKAGFINGVILPIGGGLSASNGQPSFVVLAAG